MLSNETSASRPRIAILVAIAVATWFAGVSPAPAQDDDLCLACHGDGEPVDETAYRASMHGEMEIGCTACHVDLDGTEDFPHAERLEPTDCSGCHDDVTETYADSVHGYGVLRGNRSAPTCESCHGSHEILPVSDPGSPAHTSRLSRTCGACHGAGDRVTDVIVRLPRSFDAYAHSVHGRGMDSPAGAAANCSDCHGVHDLRGPGDSASRINRTNVAETCGTCHAEVTERYAESIHGRAVRAGITDSPTCTGCHGEHLILPSAEADSRTSVGRLAMEACGACHDDPVIAAKYGLNGGVVGSYVDSYHGWAVRRASETTATCISCHTAHEVLPAEHLDSTIHPTNVAKTCGQCHIRSDDRFAASYTHDEASISANPINRWIRRFYISLIVAVVGGMLLHNLVILNYHAVEKRRASGHSGWVERFDRAQVLQHAVLALSFVALAVTGFALRYPEAWWVRRLAWLGLDEPRRAFLHRMFAIILVAGSIAHLVYVTITARGRAALRAIAPAPGDLSEMVDNLRFHTWRGSRHPQFGRFDYTQKVEYWALIWGTALMAVTGVLLWFPAVATRFLPTWTVAASQTVHFYEAWLAMLAVIVWHLFFVIFHPDEYPMSWTWLNGKMDSSTARQHHPRWHAEIGVESASPAPRESGQLRLKSLLAFPRSVARRMIRGRSNPG